MKGMLVGAILLRAVYTDLRERKIENRMMATGLITAFVCSAIRDGPNQLLYSVRMSVLTFIALFLLYVLKGLGAGDIKLFCVLAAFYPNQILWIVVMSFFCGGAFAIGMMLIRLARGGCLYIRREKLNFSIPIFVGTVLVLGFG